MILISFCMTAISSSSLPQSNAPSRSGSHSQTASTQQLCLVTVIPLLSSAGNHAQARSSVVPRPVRRRVETAKRSTLPCRRRKKTRSCEHTTFPIPASGRCTVNTTAASRAPRNTSATRSVKRLAVSNVCTTTARSRAPSLARRAWSPAFGLVRISHVPSSAVRYVYVVSVDAACCSANEIYILQICSRLPCDEPCPKDLPCGHACPSGMP